MQTLKINPTHARRCTASRGDGVVKAFSDVSDKARSWLVRRGQPGLRLSLGFEILLDLLFVITSLSL